MKKNYAIVLGLVGLVPLMIKLSSKNIYRTAKKYLNIKEIGKNQGFDNKNFENKMRKVGFKSGYDWCAIFAKLVVLESLSGDKKTELAKLMNPSSQTTFHNLKDCDLPYVTYTKTPQKGDIAFYKWTNRKWAGHVEIVSSVQRSRYTSISGNSPLESGEGVSLRARKLDWNRTPFKLLGFIRIS